MLWGREMRAGGGRSTESGGRWSSEHGGGVAPVGFGRGKRAGELREVEARLKEGSARADWVCNGGSAAGFELIGARVGGRAVPVGIERVGGVVELRGTKAKLLVWSARAEEPQRGGPTAASSSPAFGGRRRWCSWVWGWGIGKQTKGMVCGAICSAQARARMRAGALRRARHGGVAVAAARQFWAAWRREGAPARGESGSRGQGVTRGAAAKLELASGRPRAAAGGVAPSVGAGSRAGRLGKKTGT